MFLFQQKADFPLNFTPSFKPATKMAICGEIANRAFCHRFNDHGPPLANHLKQFVNKVKIRHVFVPLKKTLPEGRASVTEGRTSSREVGGRNRERFVRLSGLPQS